MSEDPLRGLDVSRLVPWLREHVPGVREPLDFALVAAGGSNLTYRVRDADGGRWALRRPPLRARLATAHDMGREWRILVALSRHPECGVPVPRALAHCEDEALIGAPFYVMDFVDGAILRGPQEAQAFDAERARTATESLVDVQVAMHRLDVDAVGLGDLGRREGYVARQLRRWRKQYEAARSRELPRVEELHAWLAARIPPEAGPAALVHGDYRFDNAVLGPDDRVRAVLDWELCTLGDPVADFVWSSLYWSDPEDPDDFGAPAPTRHPAFPRRREMIELYAARSGRDLTHLDYYVAFSCWKMACLVEGVVARLRAGAGGGRGGDVAETLRKVERLLERAAEAAERP